MKQIRINNIRKFFYTIRRGKVEALRGINLEIEAGSFFVLLGPSGCGKSTLLNMIAGLEKPSEGEIWIGDQVAVSAEKKVFLTPRQRDIAMVFQSYALYPHKTVYENIAFPLKIAKMDKAEIGEKVRNAAEILEITNLLEAKPAELSGGQRQRVALGRAIVRKPNVLLLDEPLSNLDALLRITMRSELKQIQRQLKVTTIYVTHDQIEAMSLGDRVAVLNRGEVQQVGAPTEIYHEPHNLFVAKFMGTPPMNLIEGDLAAQIQKMMNLQTGIPADKIVIGMRPEHIRLTASDQAILKGKLNLVASQGSEIIYYIQLDDQQVLVKATEKQEFREGESVGIAFDRSDLFVFDKETGERERF
jgi:multiple sugar transport system ATP-binding protein